MRIPTVASSRKGSGEPLLLVHPFATSQHVWAAVVDELAETHDVMAVTMAGHWGGPKVKFRQMSVKHLADELERAMDEAGWETAHIVGNSLGGWVAFELERRGRARSVTAIAPAGGWRRFTRDEIVLGLKFLAYLPAIVVANLLGDVVLKRRIIHRLFLRAFVGQPKLVDRAAAAEMLRAASHCPGYLAFLFAALRDGGISGLEQVKAPTLLALCERDTFLPPARYGRMFVDSLPPAAERITLPGVGHIPMLENPHLVAETIGAFVDRHTAPVVASVEHPQSA